MNTPKQLDQPLVHRSLVTHYPRAASASGAWITDIEGRRYLDACGGAAVSCLGHGHAAVKQAIQSQLAQFDYVHSSFFTSEAAESLAACLVYGAPEGLDHAIIHSGGSEAIEAALKLARQYFVEKGEARTVYLSRRDSYHGNTLGALSLSGNVARRKPYEPILGTPVRFVSACHEYRDRLDDESQEAYEDRLIAEIEDAIADVGGQHIIAFVAETVGGATLGAVPPTASYFRRIRSICDAHGILLILDEVMCGLGRTGVPHACMDEGVAPDMIVVAKGLGGGAMPVGAVLVSRRIIDMVRKGSAAINGAHTCSAHPLACAVALAVQREVAQSNLLTNVKQRGAQLREMLVDTVGRHRHVGDIRGRGLLLAIEFVQDKSRKRPLDHAAALQGTLKEAAMRNGLLLYAISGCVDGSKGNHVLLAPPFNISEQEIDVLVASLQRTMRDVFDN
jgi:adenosylmethionine-8-amino-7-oxononanoate aminotransferase